MGARDRETRVDIVLGDNHGESCAPELVEHAEHWLAARGLRVLRNQPYAGGFTTQRYGRPALARHALQIEINRALYMDEARHEKLPTAGVMERLMAGLLEEIGNQAAGNPAAAAAGRRISQSGKKRAVTSTARV